MVTFIARLKALPGEEAEAAEAIKEMVAAVEANEAGALAYVAHTAPASPGEFLFYEVYAGEAAKNTHMKTPYLKKLVALMGPVFDPAFGVRIEDLERLSGSVRA